jgi:hypothetical protein
MEDQNGGEHQPDELADDEAAEIRYSLTALGEKAIVERRRARFYGFGPCAAAVA